MAGSIANLAIKLSADPSALFTSLEQAEKRLSSWSRNAGAALAEPVKQLSVLASAPLHAVESFLAPLSSISFAGAGFTAFVHEVTEEIVSVGKAAHAVGFDIQDFSALVSGGAVPLEGFEHAL